MVSNLFYVHPYLGSAATGSSPLQTINNLIRADAFSAARVRRNPHACSCQPRGDSLDVQGSRTGSPTIHGVSQHAPERDAFHASKESFSPSHSGVATMVVRRNTKPIFDLLGQAADFRQRRSHIGLKDRIALDPSVPQVGTLWSPGVTLYRRWRSAWHWRLRKRRSIVYIWLRNLVHPSTETGLCRVQELFTAWRGNGRRTMLAAASANDGWAQQCFMVCGRWFWSGYVCVQPTIEDAAGRACPQPLAGRSTMDISRLVKIAGATLLKMFFSWVSYLLYKYNYSVTMWYVFHLIFTPLLRNYIYPGSQVDIKAEYSNVIGDEIDPYFETNPSLWEKYSRHSRSLHFHGINT